MLSHNRQGIDIHLIVAQIFLWFRTAFCLPYETYLRNYVDLLCFVQNSQDQFMLIYLV